MHSPLHWLSSSLNRKFALGTAAGLLISSLVFLVLFVNLYHAELEQERTSAALQVNRLLQTSLENAMLKRDLEGLADIVARLGRQPGILAVMITNPEGAVRFSSDPGWQGLQIPPAVSEDGGPTTGFIRDATGRDVLRSINPVRNKEPCEGCHGPITKHPVNGILYVDFEATSIREHARNTILFLMGSGALIVVINLAGGWWFIRRYVIGPVEHLSEISRQLSCGNLAARSALGGTDELANLGVTFNDMAVSLHGKMRELKEKEQFLQRLVDAIPDGVRIIDQEYQVILANDTYRQQMHLDQPEGATGAPQHRCYAAHNRDTRCPTTLLTCPLQEVTRTKSPLRVVHRHQRSDGSTLDVEIYAAPLSVVLDGVPELLVVESIRDLEQQVRFSHEQKLSELGRLAAGVAHEIHNPLASVRLALYGAQRANEPELADRRQVQEYLELVNQEVDRCIQVTERLLKLSVLPPSQPELVDLDSVVQDTVKLLQWEAQTRSVKVRMEMPDVPLRIMATDSEMRMVVLNLAQNALHAMPKGGDLAVRCARDNGCVEVEFADTGVGIRPTDLERIFEPFFSRRADGVRGTGLGLSITKAIVDNYQGSIEVQSAPGSGSRFLVRFPDADAEREV